MAMIVPYSAQKNVLAVEKLREAVWDEAARI